MTKTKIETETETWTIRNTTEEDVRVLGIIKVARAYACDMRMMRMRMRGWRTETMMGTDYYGTGIRAMR